MGSKGYGIWMVAPGRVELRAIDVPDPSPGEIQVRCVANGICMGEVSLFMSAEPLRAPLIVGHEGIGVVTRVGRDVTGYAEGDWVSCWGWASLADYNVRLRGCPTIARYAAPPPDPATFIAEPA
jgi:D-arabinose 1-dehydrogenase-like Zn-dependent alcohol dehydrogenase